MTELCKDIGQICSRLFDHRPFLNGEIKFMLKEFEEKRGDREIVHLFTILEKLTDLNDTQLLKIQASASSGLPKIKSKLDDALDLIKEIDKDIKEHKKIKQDELLAKHIKRQEEWNLFNEDIKFKYQRIDNAFEEKEEELKDFYTDLNHKLQINK